MPFNIGGTTVITDDSIVSLTNGATGSRPASPVTGQLWYNTTTAKLEVWNGSAWKEAATTGSASVPPVWSWGSNSNGRLGDNTGVLYSKSSPVSVVGGFTDWVQVSAGRYNSIAIRANGTAWSWGRGSFGLLGNNSTTDRSSPVSVVGGFTDWVQVSAGSFHNAAIRANGTIWTWGYNASGRLGDGSTTSSRVSPVSVVGGFTDWVQVSAGEVQTAAVRANGTAWSWGSGVSGRLGDGTTTTKSSPVSVVGGFTDWVQVSAGGNHTAAVRANGSVWSWGIGSSGQLGNNSTTNRSSPVSAVGGFTDWVQVSAGNLHTVAIRANGTAWSWGNGGSSQLGNNSTTDRSSPVSVVGGFTDWVQVEAGRYSSIAIRANGTAWAWGVNNTGRLGDGTTTTTSSPVSVVGGFTDWIQVSFGDSHNLAIRSQPRVQSIRPDRVRPLI